MLFNQNVLGLNAVHEFKKWFEFWALKVGCDKDNIGLRFWVYI